MTLQNITISTINNTDLYFLKADGSDFIQAPISETTHIGVLRYAPTDAGLYQGEVYVNASALKQYQKFPVALTVLNVLTVDVFVSIADPGNDPDYAGWFQVGKGLPVVGTSFGLLESDVPVGADIWVMVRDTVNAGVYDIKTAHVYATVSLLTYPDHAEIDDTLGIQVGTSDTAFSSTDTALSAKIDNGSGSGELLYSEMPYSNTDEPSTSGSKTSTTLTRRFENSSGASIAIKEVGIMSVSGLLCRFIPEIPITIENGASEIISIVFESEV